MPTHNDFFDLYFEYIGNTECPALFHRWCALSGIGALLGRNLHLQHGHFTINSNMYTMLIGSPGTRKSTAIKMLKKVIQEAGYDKVAADKTTKEKFLMDLSGEAEDAVTGTEILDKNLWGDDDTSIATRPASECYIMADEWNDFTSLGNLEFYSLLGTLWDYNGIYKNRIKTGKSVSINNPTISILSGNTPTGFSLAFPPEIMGQGFFSRLVLVYGESTGKKIAFPKPPDPQLTQDLVAYMQKLRFECQGEIVVSRKAESLLEYIYTTYTGFDDSRFESYMNRRFSHLLKICILITASRLSTTIEENDVIYANTILTHTEHLMPKALGEFGKGKNSDVTNKILESLTNTTVPLTHQKLWELHRFDFEKQSQLSDILGNLKAADKIIAVNRGFLAKHKPRKEATVTRDAVDYNLLRPDEKD